MQPLLPLYSREFRVTPATASFMLSVPTTLLALMLILTAALSQVWVVSR